jgi:ATPase family associated with various cellular activities (AAA)
MAESAVLLRPRPERASHDLTARAGTTALRVAGLLEATCSPASGAASSVAFLRAWAHTAVRGRPAPPRQGPMDELADRFGLDEDERELLLLAGLPDEHEGLAGTFRALHPHAEPYPTVGLAALLLAGPEGDRARLRRLLTEGPLVRGGLAVVAGEGPLFERSLVIADRLWGALHGHDAWPRRIGRVPVAGAPAGLDGWVDLPAVTRAVAALRTPAARTLLVAGSDEVVALSRCAALARAAGVTLVAGRVLLDDAEGVALVVAHAAARRAVPVLVVAATADGGPAAAPTLDLAGLPGPVLVCAPPGSARPAGQRPIIAVPLGPIRAADRRRAWRAALPELADQAPALAARHPVDPAVTAEVAADVRDQRMLPGAGPGTREVAAAIRNRAGMHLPAGVQLATPAVSWDRLVLPPEPAAQLRDAVARLEHGPLVLDDWGFLDGARADRGVRLLLTGPPGTGKSLAAEVLATAADTDLLVVDVSRIVSKWIGETEKNLAAVFDAAERTQAVLLLDEADALFGARTEVTDAHDRYANLETAYLLQRLDRFDGLAVLATNLSHNIDPAFVRRMDFVVDIALPDEAARARLWRLYLPPCVALAGDVDLSAFARLYAVPGGWIRNAAVAAAFLAAPAGGPIRAGHLVRAMRREYAKAAQPFPGEPVTARGE